MRKVYKNKLFEWLRLSPFGIDNFTYNEEPIQGKPESLRLKYKSTPFYFWFETNSNNIDLFGTSYTLYLPQFPFEQDRAMVQPFEMALSAFNQWLNNQVKKYLDDQATPDFWAEYLRTNAIVNIEQNDFDNRSQFTIDERAQVKLALNELKNLIQENFHTNVTQQQIVNNRLDYLEAATNRLNKFDWQSVALNTLISISIALSLDTEKGHQLFHFFAHVFAAIRTLPLPHLSV